MLRSTIIKWLLVLLIVYLASCLALFYMQQTLIFPAYLTKPVPSNWQPQGTQSEQAHIQGACGDIHLALWRIDNAKGTIMLFHGNGESLASIDDGVNDYLNLGYNLMSWDYPGYGQSTNCQFDEAMLLANAAAAYQWLAAKEHPQRIHIFGYSVGSGIALSVASRFNHNPVLIAAGYDALINVVKDTTWHLAPVTLLSRFHLNTALWLENIQQPIYLIHGTNDMVIRAARGQALFDQANGKASMEWVKDAGHADARLFDYRQQWLKRLLP